MTQQKPSILICSVLTLQKKIRKRVIVSFGVVIVAAAVCLLFVLLTKFPSGHSKSKHKYRQTPYNLNEQEKKLFQENGFVVCERFAQARYY